MTKREVIGRLEDIKFDVQVKINEASQTNMKEEFEQDLLALIEAVYIVEESIRDELGDGND